MNPDIISYQQRIQNSIEFKHFKKTFTEKVEFFKSYTNDVIRKNEVIDEHDLLEETMDLLNQRNIEYVGPIQPNPNTKFIFIKDPNGMKVQLVEI